jgi:ribosomal protein S18 acetylase RimI-like enzyme
MGGRGAVSAGGVSGNRVVDAAGMQLNDPVLGKIQAKIFTIRTEDKNAQITIVAAPNSYGGHEAFGKTGMNDAHNLQPGKVRSYEISSQKVQAELKKRGLEDRDVLGFVHFKEAVKGTMLPGFVIVHPAFQRQGIATRMYDEASKLFPRGAKLGKGAQRTAGKNFRKKYERRRRS